MEILPIAVPDLRRATGGPHVSRQHLEGGGFSCSVHSQQTKALHANTQQLVIPEQLSTWQPHGAAHPTDYKDVTVGIYI